MPPRLRPTQRLQYATGLLAAAAIGLGAPAWAETQAAQAGTPAATAAAAPTGTREGTSPGPGLFFSGRQGPLVVLQAGLGDDHRTWAAVVADLARDHRVVTIDRPGYAGLPASDAARDPCTQADEARQRLLAAGLAPPYLLVGHSLGGRYALAQAWRHPQEAAGLVLVDATPPGHWPRMQAETPGLASLMKVLRATVFDATSRREFDDQDACMDALTATPPAATSGGTAIPTVVLASGRRRPEETAEFAALLARGQALWLPLTGAAQVEVAHDAGHHIQRDAPDRVAAAVRRISALAGPGVPLSDTRDHTLPEALREALPRLQPGISTRQQVQQALGEPSERQTHADAEVWIYNPRKGLPPLVGWLPVLGDVLEVAELAHQRLRRHELILEFDAAGLLKRRTVRALDG